MRGIRVYIVLSAIVATAAMVALFSGSSSGTASAGILAEPHGQIDVELAFDTTKSMGPSIEQARRDGASIVAQVRDVFPDTRFAVVSFRDYGNPSGDYEVLQPMTGDTGAVQAAFLKLRAASNPSPLNTSAEEYNLLFHKSYTDATVDWRPQARKVVVVVGDAQPHSAGASGIAGCTDTSSDYYGLNTADVLAGMRAAGRTLVMIRQISAETTVSLGCYETMAQRAYVGGAARNGGDADLAGPIVRLIQEAVAPVTLRPDIGLALPGGSSGYTATVSNPNRFALDLRSLAVTLPAGFRYRSGPSAGVMTSAASRPTMLSWPIQRVVRPSEKVSFHFRARASKRRGRFATQAAFRLQLPGGHVMESTSAVPLRVTPRRQSLFVSAHGERPLKGRGTASLRGAVRIAFTRGVRAAKAGRLVRGSLVLRRGPGQSIVLRIRRHRIVAFGSPTVLRLDLEVERARGVRGCSRRTRGSVLIADDQRLRATGLRRDTVVTSFGAGCRIAAGRWSNAGSARSTVTAIAR
jgi:hypothetical protein